MPHLSLQPGRDAVPQPLGHRVERGKRGRVVPAGLREHLLASEREHECPPRGIPLQQPTLEPPGRAGRAPAVCQPPCHIDGHAFEDGGMDQLIHDATAIRHARRKHLAGEDDVEGRLEPDEPRETLAPTCRRDDAKLDLRETELGLLVLRCHAVRAGKGGFEPPAEACTVDGRHDGLAKGGNTVDESLAGPDERVRSLARRERDELVDVRTGDERVFLARQEHDPSDRGVSSQGGEDGVELVSDTACDLVDRFAW